MDIHRSDHRLLTTTICCIPDKIPSPQITYLIISLSHLYIVFLLVYSPFSVSFVSWPPLCIGCQTHPKENTHRHTNRRHLHLFSCLQAFPSFFICSENAFEEGMGSLLIPLCLSPLHLSPSPFNQLISTKETEMNREREREKGCRGCWYLATFPSLTSLTY